LERRDSSILDVLKGNVRVFCYGKYRIRDIRNISVYHRLCKDIVKRDYDVIHFQSPGTPWIALFYRIYRKFPLVMTVHNPYPHFGLPLSQKLYEDFVQKIFVPIAKKIIVHSSLLKRQLLERYNNKKAGDVRVVPHGDFSIMKHWDKGENNSSRTSPIKNVLFFGTVRPNKGLEYLIKAEPIISKSFNDYRIIIAGKFDNFERYKKLVDNNAKISFINEFVPYKEVPKYFYDASIVVLPYISATQTGIIHLAYAFGKPVIATRVGAIPEIVDDGKTGFLVEPQKERALADAIVKLLSNDKLLEEMGKNALLYCKENLSWDSISKKTIKIYEQII
jgi:glycosyltransferase involved in cell wall biosynthesis